MVAMWQGRAATFYEDFGIQLLDYTDICYLPTINSHRV